MAVYTTITKIDGILPKYSADEPVELREEQVDAVKGALNYFKKRKGQKNLKYLWNAKMRFGKTLCALKLAKLMGEKSEGDARVQRTLIISHRPVVKNSWKEDFDKTFGRNCQTCHYGTKFDDDSTDNFYELERAVKERGESYIFFASMQYLRRSTLVGGDNDEQLKKDILQNHWDLVVIDEAHEGTQTNLGQRVIDVLTKDTLAKALYLSGTPFNLYEDFTDEQIYTWDYIKEQSAKCEWKKKHPLLPQEENPYFELPEMEIRTFDLGNLVRADLGTDVSCQLKEFFRTYQGQNIPEDKKGKFVHEDAVREFLDRMCQEDENSHYPFSTEEYRTFFNHTLWVVPGVKEAKALENLLHDHEIFGSFDAIINVAGNNDADEASQDALQRVKDKIGDRPDLTYTITISCGRLTTGVTVRPWTAIFYMKGSENTSAATYMQTIFRVQSPYHFTDSNGDILMKTKCYVFDFAPDRSLKMVAETAKFATLTQKQKQYAKAATSQEKDMENMENFLAFCPVIAMDGGKMVEYKAEKLFAQLEKVYIDRVVRNGFNDNSLYNIRELMQLNPDEVKDLDLMGVEISKTTNMDKPKRVKNIDISKNKLTPSQSATVERAKKHQKEGKKLTEGEIAALAAEKKRKEEERKERDNRISVLRGIALRIPLLMYGANVDYKDTPITLDNFTRLIDDASWAEFMPRGVDKKAFNKFKKCFNAGIFVEAGKRYGDIAREADDMHVDERIQRIAEIFSYFHNPDKETVLTPWRVVNMHMSDCLGGYTFFNERFDGPNEKQIVGKSDSVIEWIPTTEPRYVNRGEVTKEVFGDSSAKILEINSKTGLYPLYVAYSLYRQRCNDYVQAGLIKDANNYSIEEEHVIWDDILANNVFVICNTPMAVRITHTTLLGSRTLIQKNGTEQVNIKSEKLIERATKDKDALIKDICTLGYWRGTRNKEQMVFSAVVGNPPYQYIQSTDNCTTNAAFASAIYPTFIDLARALNPKYVSMITPSRWMTKTGQGISETWVDEMILCNHFMVIHDFYDALDCFNGVEIKGGVNYFLYSGCYDGECLLVSHRNKQTNSIFAKLNSHGAGIVIRDMKSTSIFEKVIAVEGEYADGENFSKYVSPQHYFDKAGLLTTSWTGYAQQSDGEYNIKYYLNKQVESQGYGWIRKEDIPKNLEALPLHKVYLSKAYNGGDAFPHQIIGKPFYGEPNSVCSQTYLAIGCNLEKELTEEECNNIIKYMSTLFFRHLVFIKKKTQDNPSSVFQFVPLQDFTSNSDIDWSKSVAEIDQQLYKKYGLSQDEQDFIESMIKPME